MTVEFLKKNIMSLPSIVLERAFAIYVYGSVARGDNDADSDCDLFVCIDDCPESDYLQLKEAVSIWEEKYKCEFSFYQVSMLVKMQKRGSYFLWHIRKEGILLFQQNEVFKSILTNLCPYGETREDFLEYSEILGDIERSVYQDNITLEYELSVLAVLARNICIGCCYLMGNMDFGRRTPVIKCINFFKNRFPFSLTSYDELYEFRLALIRNKSINCELVSVEYVEDWIEKIKKLLILALEMEE